jgi:hypothetical protein
MKYPCEEVTFEMELYNHKVRLWFNADSIYFDGGYLFTEDIKDDLIQIGRVKPEAKIFAKNIAATLTPRGLNAVQVINLSYNAGYMIYTVPFEDKDAKAI